MVNFTMMLHPTRPAKKDGSKAVVLRVTNERLRKYIGIGYSCKPEFWDHRKGLFKKAYNPENFKELNNTIKLKIAKAERIVMDFDKEEKPFIYEPFKEKFLIKNEKKTVLSFFDYKIDELTKLGNIGNAEVYKVAKNALERFKPDKNARFQDITVKFLIKYEAFLRNDGCANNTINNYIRTLRALYNTAIDEGLISKDHYPFYNNHTRAGYKIGKLKTATVKRAISMADLKKIQDYQPKELSIEQDAKLFFLFSYYAWGINFIDMANLKWDKNIQYDAIVYSRIKTRHTKTFRVPIKTQLADIFDHYRNYDNDGYVFPILSDFHDTPMRKKTRVKTAIKKINNALGDIGEDLGISTPLTTYVARHTFASTLKNKDVPASVIKEMMGHANEETTEIYLKEFSNDVLSVASENLNIE